MLNVNSGKQSGQGYTKVKNEMFIDRIQINHDPALK